MNGTVDLGALINTLLLCIDDVWHYINTPFLTLGIFTFSIFNILVAFVIADLLIDIIDDYDDEREH